MTYGCAANGQFPGKIAVLNWSGAKSQHDRKGRKAL